MLVETGFLASYEADDLVVRLIAMFAEDAPRLARMIIDAKDSETRARAAHALRGCALNLGAGDLAALCGAIESTARASGETKSIVSSLDALVASTLRALEAHCSGMQRAPL